MKCALEIMNIHEKAMNQYITEKENKAEQKHLEACANAIKLCENVIGPAFEKKAKNNTNYLALDYQISTEKDIFGNIHFNILETRYRSHTVHHRDGTTSKKNKPYTVSVYCNIDKATLIAYLEKHCYTCPIFHTSWLNIKPMSKCLN